MDDALRANIHPAAGGHLSIVRHPHLLTDLPVLLVVEMADHEGVGDDDTRGFWARREKPQRVTAHDDQGGVLGELGEVFLDEPVLQPIVADATGLTVGDEFVGIKGDVEVEVIVNLHLEGLALGTTTLVIVDGASLDMPGWTPPVSVDAAIRTQFLEELRSSLLV